MLENRLFEEKVQELFVQARSGVRRI